MRDDPEIKAEMEISDKEDLEDGTDLATTSLFDEEAKLNNIET